MSCTVYLVRHGESEANAGLKTSDPYLIPLSEKGRQEAILLAKEFQIETELIIVTPYLRTYETALPVIRKFSTVPVESWPFHEFTYLSPLNCRNTTRIDRLEQVKTYWDKCDPDLIDGIGAESFRQCTHRVIQGIDSLRRLNKRNVVVFTHGQIIQMINQFLSVQEQPLSEAMVYFRDQMLKFPIRNGQTIKINLYK